MSKRIKQLLALLLVAVSLLGLTACGEDALSVLDDGASMYGDSKPQESYFAPNSGAILDELILKYSGGHKLPTPVPMTDADYDKAKQTIGGDSDPADPSGTADPGTQPDPADPGTQPDPADPGNGQQSTGMPEVADWDDLLRVMYAAYSATADCFEFRSVNGFTFDPTVDLQAAFNELQRDDPIYVSCVRQWSYGNNGDECLVTIDYTVAPDELKRVKDATAQLVDEAAARIPTAGLSDYEIVCAVNDYLYDNCYYPEQEPYAPLTHTAYGALTDGEVVCEGYACAAKLLLNKFGIRCDIQVGDCIGGGGHAWNLVMLDGQWYQLDITWNDCSNDRDAYLLVTDEYMRVSRTWDYSKYPASATEPYTP